MITRSLSRVLASSKKSVLLLGPRQTGKSTLIQALQPDLSINLADESEYLSFARNSREIYQRLKAQKCRTVFIDEIQRIPGLLNTLQVILDDKKNDIKFYLTGSSARKLKRGKANLLPGRLHSYHLGPLVTSEIGYDMDTAKALSVGTLPGIWVEEDKAEREKTLRDYAAIYLKEEIQAEALTRNVEGFSRFLFVVAAESGKFLDLAKLCSEAALPRQSAIRYFEILEDTMIVRRCEAFRKSERKRLVQRPKYFFFDTGVLNGLLSNFIPSPDRAGILFEHLIFNQIIDSAQSKDKDIRVSSYRTSHGAEVDFILEIDRELYAIEVKSASQINHIDSRGMKSFLEYVGRKCRPVILYNGAVKKVIDGMSVLPWQEFMRDLGI